MTTDVGQCKLCEGYYRMANGRLPEHPSLKTGEPCRGRLPSPGEYPVGFDTEPPWILRGGLWERDRRRF